MSIVTEQEFLACDCFGFDQFSSDSIIEAKVTPPLQGVFNTLDSRSDIVFGGA